jgi:hypothetical protein
MECGGTAHSAADGHVNADEYFDCDQRPHGDADRYPDHNRYRHAHQHTNID